jgi:hypothetical protein
LTAVGFEVVARLDDGDPLAPDRRRVARSTFVAGDVPARRVKGVKMCL